MAKVSVIATYKMVVKEGFSLREAAELLADEQSLGLKEIPEEKARDLARKFGPPAEIEDVIFSGERDLIFRVSFPLDYFKDVKEVGMSGLLNLVAGDAFASAYHSGLKLLDLRLPEDLLNMYAGPSLGVQGLKEVFGEEGPYLGVIVKPSVGITLDYLISRLEDSLKCGVNVLKDDEKAVSLRNATKYEKLERVTEKLRRKRDRGIVYAFNVSGRLSHTLDLVRRISEVNRELEGGRIALMITAVTMGLSVLENIRDLLNDLGDRETPIYVHRTMHAAFTKNRDHGVDMKVLIKLFRVAGADIQHIGAIMGSHPRRGVEAPARLKRCLGPLRGIRRSMPVVSGGLHLGNIEANIRDLNVKDVILMVGRGAYVKGVEGFREVCSCLKDLIEKVKEGERDATIKLKGGCRKALFS